MDRERLVEIIKEGTLVETHLEALEELVEKYPWFALPRFLRLKALEQMGQTPDSQELSRAVVFSSDRKHLYKWVKGTFESIIETSGFSGTELEFMDSDEEIAGAVEGEEDPFFLLDDEDESAENDDADASPIPEKDESEMEEPDVEDSDVVPVIDPLDDEEESGEELSGEEISGEEEPGEEESLKSPATQETVAEVDPVAQEPSREPGAEEPGAEEPIAKEDPVADEVTAVDGRAVETDAQYPESNTVSDAAANSQSSPNPSLDLIERFLKSEPGVIKADKQTNLEGDVSEGSVQEDDSFITDTLAKIYVKQGLHAKAIYAYERLSLKYPEKSAYFAAQIEKIKNNANV